MTDNLSFQSLWIPLNARDKLHLMRVGNNPQGPVVFMLHGSIASGRAFYTLNGKGLAPYLARAGYDVYVADLRGRGLSTPTIGRHSDFGQTQVITEEIPAFLAKIEELRGTVAQHWIGHSWGALLLYAYLARFSAQRERLRSLICFGTKRRIRVFNWEKFWKVNFFWLGLGSLLTRIFGYFPAKIFMPGADNETRKSHAQSIPWLKEETWVDPEDGFPYGEAIRNIELPPTLHLTGAHDHALGHARDVSDFLHEIGAQHAEFRLIGRAQGYRHNYNHLNILTHPDAVLDHFPLVLQWLEK